MTYTSRISCETIVENIERAKALIVERYALWERMGWTGTSAERAECQSLTDNIREVTHEIGLKLVDDIDDAHLINLILKVRTKTV